MPSAWRQQTEERPAPRPSPMLSKPRNGLSQTVAASIWYSPRSRSAQQRGARCGTKVAQPAEQPSRATVLGVLIADLSTRSHPRTAATSAEPSATICSNAKRICTTLAASSKFSAARTVAPTCRSPLTQRARDATCTRPTAAGHPSSCGSLGTSSSASPSACSRRARSCGRSRRSSSSRPHSTAPPLHRASDASCRRAASAACHSGREVPDDAALAAAAASASLSRPILFALATAAFAFAASSAAERAAAAAGSAGAGAPQYASRVVAAPPSPFTRRGVQPRSPRGWLQYSHRLTPSPLPWTNAERRLFTYARSLSGGTSANAGSFSSSVNREVQMPMSSELVASALSAKIASTSPVCTTVANH
mmetsp:Transcript_14248/g.46112  ORF Transcript_14248/g.46112 Transcript_14248/m.46112 type:complete len:364 (+) Transcript_14248:928-2019(+)